MNMENPDGMEVGSGASSAEIESIESIKSAESRLGASATRLKESMGKSPSEKKLEDPDTREKIWQAWDRAQLRATEAFTAFMGLSFSAMIWTQETYNAGQAALQSGADYMELTERLQQLQNADLALLGATAAIPIIMLGMSKLSKMRREKNLTNPATA